MGVVDNSLASEAQPHADWNKFGIVEVIQNQQCNALHRGTDFHRAAVQRFHLYLGYAAL